MKYVLNILPLLYIEFKSLATFVYIVVFLPPFHKLIVSDEFVAEMLFVGLLFLRGNGHLLGLVTPIVPHRERVAAQRRTFLKQHSWFFHNTIDFSWSFFDYNGVAAVQNILQHTCRLSVCAGSFFYLTDTVTTAAAVTAMRVRRARMR